MTNDNWGKVGDKDPVIGNGFIETTTGGTIVIVPDRTEDTPKTEDQKNPSIFLKKSPPPGGFFYAPCPLSSPQNGRIFVHSYKLLFATLHPPILVLQ